MEQDKGRSKAPREKEIRPCPPPVIGWSKKHNRLASEEGYASWEDWTNDIQQVSGRNICGALARTKQTPCTARPLHGKRGNGRCRMHGGKNGAGPAAGNWRHGRNSKYLPDDLLEDYREAFTDPDYLSLRSQISVNEAREAELIRQLGDNAPRWGDLERISTALTNAVVEGDMDKVMKESTRISELVVQGRKRGLLWDKIEQVQEHGKKLKTAESKIMKDRDMTLDKDRAMALVMWLIAMLRERISDRVLLSEIAADIRSRIRAPARAVEIPAKTRVIER